MSIKISELPEATSVSPSDLIPIVQDGTTKKATASMLQGINYSTSEHLVGTWIDGKPLYEKVVTGTSPTVTTDGTGVTSVFGIASNIDRVFVPTAFVEYDGGNSVWTMPYYNNSMYFIKAQIGKASGVKKLQITSNGTVYNNTTFICVIRYTKTTDTRSLNLIKGISGEEELGEKAEEQLLTPVEYEKELKKDILDDKEELKKADIEDVDIKSENIESGDKLEDVSDEQANKPTDIW